MSAVLQVADQRLGAEDICALLTSPQVLPHLLRELIVEQITATVDCTTEELESAFREMSQLPQYRSLPPAQVERLIPRHLKLEKFKTANWSDQVEAEFLQHQERYDQVLFSLIQTDNLEIIQELYFRLREGETNFGEVATQYSQGPEARTNGLVGPLELYNLHPKLSHMLRISQPGQVSPPFRVDQWVVIVRLERYLPAQFDAKLRQRLIDEKYETWMQQAIAQHANSVRVPEVLDLPTIDLQDQADLKLKTSENRPRLAPASTKIAPAKPPAPKASAPQAKVKSTELESPFADETLLDAELATETTPTPANETIAFKPPSKTGLSLNKIPMPQFKGSLWLAILPLLLVLGALAALLGWDTQLQTFTQTFWAPSSATKDMAKDEVVENKVEGNGVETAIDATP
ncbi:MAG: peptidylprolyl isomerase, partial [Spirulina sp. SIO3F2]|nr:peptidylprolyl isomerase [Spirulina sp. SIO3F2]